VERSAWSAVFNFLGLERMVTAAYREPSSSAALAAHHMRPFTYPMSFLSIVILSSGLKLPRGSSSI